jgi:ParB-like chromosome segregation protein Spo0J
MSELKIVYKKVDELIPYAMNARTHSDDQITAIASSIKEFNWSNPILTDGDNGIIAGHGRLMAAKKLGMDKVPCIELKHLSPAQKRALVLADNKIAMNSGWDFEMLKLELAELGDDAELTGFSQKELLDLLSPSDDALPEQENLDAVFEVAVTCKDEAEQQQVFDYLNEKGYKCRVLTM